MILSNPFDQQQFTDFVDGFLPDFELDVRKVEASNFDFKEVLRLGSSTSLRTDVLVIRSTRNINNRISLTNNSFRIMKKYSIFRALAVYVNDDDETIWRLSLLTATPSFKDGKVVQSLSNPRRHSYVLGTEIGIATARKYLSSMGRVNDFHDLEFRFSVEAVNRDFYKEIAGHFYDLVGRYEPKREILKPPLLKLPQNNTRLEDLQNYSVRLLGRILFLWFLRQKLSPSGLPLLPKITLDWDFTSPNSFLHERLEPIFFEVLNKPMKQRRSEFQTEIYNKVPYLNGGLFHPADGSAGDYYSTVDLKSGINIPNEWFTKLLETLTTYNFTIDENLENDVDLSIDPEMLGRVFENLLAEINPETGQIARKSTGSYYTPRAIVNFMVDSSLLTYLVSKTAITEEKIRALISTSKLDDIEYPLSINEKHKVVDAIRNLRVLDPACGSGAFPMGTLQKLLWIIGEVDPEGDEYLEIHDMEGTEHWLSSNRLDYLRKRKIIRDVIFGIDIQSVAVEIAKLRCFLTLIVDQEITDNSDNRGVVPLPNLDFKFICADSLTPLKEFNQQSLGDDPLLEQKLANVRKKYFSTTNEDKKVKLRKEYEMLTALEPTLFGESLRNRQIKSFQPLISNSQAIFFDLNTMFGLHGFQIVIGNPPYKVLEGKDSTDILENLRSIKSYKYAIDKGKLNLYRHFIERSSDFLIEGGVLSFIVPSTLISDSNTQGIRKMFREKGSLQFIIEFPENEKVFESVTQATTIFAFVKGNKTETFQLAVGLNKADLPPERFAEIKWEDIRQIYGETLTLPLVNSTEHFDLVKKLANSGQKLSQLARCYKGDINLGYFKDNLRNTKSTSLLIRGDHVSPFFVNLSEEQTDRRWIQMDSMPSAAMKQRIVCQNVSNMGLRQRVIASLVPSNVVVADSCNCLEVIADDIDELILLGYLNSTLLNWFFKKTSTNNHVNIYELDDLPIRKPSASQASKLRKMVSRCIEEARNNPFSSGRSTSMESIMKELDELVFEIYGVDAKEVEIIQQSV